MQGGGLGFRHPLVRSAVASAADPVERAAVLRALVDTIADPARTVWWRADLESGPDPDLAAELEQLGEAGLAAGDAALALRALRRAAELTRASPQRTDRLLRAAGAADRIGAHRIALGLIEAADAETDDPRAHARAAWMRELLPLEESALTHGDLRPATAAIGDLRRAGDADAALDALLHLASIAWGLSTDPIPVTTSRRRRAPSAWIPTSRARSC